MRSLRGPAADPRRGDRTPCGAAAPRGAGAGARATAGAACPRRLTPRDRAHRRRRRPRLFADPAGRVPALISPTSRRLAGPSAARYTPPTVMTRRPTMMTRHLGGHQAVWRGQERPFSLPRFCPSNTATDQRPGASLNLAPAPFSNGPPPSRSGWNNNARLAWTSS